MSDRTDTPRLTALLPMKGHSARVPGKNLRPLLGRPLFHWTAAALQASDLVERIVVNTDSEAIAESVAAHFSKAVVHWRPEAIRGDEVSMNRIIADDLSRLEGEHFLQTHSTNPLLATATIQAAVRAYFAGLPGHDSLFTVTPQRKRFYWPDGRPVNHDPAVLLPTQDLPPLLEENSNLYLFSRASFRAAGQRRIGLTPQLFPMDPLEALDIDEESDFHMAGLLLAGRAGRAGA
ncbi:MAG: hypothetical protein AB7D57_04655 [Desulfovibrionaceae bacterium]